MNGGMTNCKITGIILRRKGRALAERLWSRVDTSAGANGCWNWTGATVRGWYGQIRLDPIGNEVSGKKSTTHRVVWELTFGPIPSGMHVCHRCDNPRCVNPAHLWLGTHAENLSDMKAKGRAARGERSGTARLNAKQVQIIRKLLQSDVCGIHDLSTLTGTSPATIHAIKHRKTWSHIDA